jgi:hypothetical protein
MLAIDPELFGDIQGSTDTEVVFHLALRSGLRRIRSGRSSWPLA